MSIRYKVSLPLALITLLVGAVAFWLIRGQLDKLNESNIATLVENKAHEIEQSIDSTGKMAMRMAALVSRLPEVLEAYKVALSGNIDDEKSPQSQQAREMLRKALAPSVDGYAALLNGVKPQFHFHLPNARSLARVWRGKNVLRDGQWLDVSDDLSTFRALIVEHNKSGKPLSGVEVGMGGFEIRGLSPITDASGKRLGSVEMLLEFEPVLAAGAEGKGQTLSLYMNSELLRLATKFADSSKYPELGGKYIRAVAPSNSEVEKYITPDILEQGKAGLSWRMVGNLALAAFPIKDFKGSVVGILAYSLDATAQQGIMGRAELVLGAAMLTLLVVPALAAFLVLALYVVRPVNAMVGKIKDIAQDRANLSERLDDSNRDEVGALATWFNRLMGKIEDILCQVDGFKNLVNAVPDPIYAVDDDFKILVANTAAEKYLNCSQDKLKGTYCFDHFKTMICRTDDCPVTMARKAMGKVEAGVINFGTESKPVYIQPTGDLLKDCYGKQVGFVEVARIVTDLVLKEKESERMIQRMGEVNAEVASAASHLADSTDTLVHRFGDVTRGAAEQNVRAAETATAMEEMNATVMEVAKSASDAANQAASARDKAQSGAQVVSKAVEAIAQVRTQALDIKTNMNQLGKQAEGIGQIINVITDIADQTNLLALNAAIEAARAGDAGRGFAVVADEVRKLAEKTMTATKQVDEAITAIQQGARANLEVVEKAASAVENATDLANQSGQALEEIVHLVVITTDRVQSIAAAAEEQSATSDEINRAVTDVTRIADETASGMAEANQAVRELAELALKLQQLSRS